MKIIKRITFLLFILSIIVFLDLAHNYFNATFTELHDGIMLTGFFSKIIYGDNSWSLFEDSIFFRHLEYCFSAY